MSEYNWESKIFPCCNCETKIDQCSDSGSFCSKDMDIAYQQGRADAIDEFINKMKKFYWSKELQSAKEDPCVIDAMIDLSIRTVRQVKE